jgi:hypothetical protein
MPIWHAICTKVAIHGGVASPFSCRFPFVE